MDRIGVAIRQEESKLKNLGYEYSIGIFYFHSIEASHSVASLAPVCSTGVQYVKMIDKQSGNPLCKLCRPSRFINGGPIYSFFGQTGYADPLIGWHYSS